MPLLLLVLLAVQTPAAPANPPRLALAISRAIQPISQPSFDRWANDAASRFATRFSVAIVPATPSNSQVSAASGFCPPLCVVGVLNPGRLWRMSSTKVTMTVEYALFDCDGDLFYDGISHITQARNLAMIPQAQIESIASHATDAFLADFARFAESHPAQWSRLLATGSIRDVTPTPAPTGWGPAPRLATVVGIASTPLTQPRFERFVDEASTRFAARFSVTALPIPVVNRPQFANPALCKSLGIVGFIVPAWHWITTSKTVSATARLFIFDCAGDRFFDDAATFTEPRNGALIPQAQIESTSSQAIGLVLEKFATFVSGHKVLWSRVLATGSMRDATLETPSPAPPPTPSLALVVKTANQPAMQPSFERFSHDTATRFAQQFSIGAVPIPGDERPQIPKSRLVQTAGRFGVSRAGAALGVQCKDRDRDRSAGAL